MEISEYDEYVPERELDKNFKIPRKRTAEDSFGAQAGEAYAEYYAQAAQAAQLQYNQAQAAAAYAQYATLSGAASQATAYTNSKPPVQYPVTKPTKVDTSIQPPLPPSYGTGSMAANTNYGNPVAKNEIAAPNTNPYAPLITSTTSSQNVPKPAPNKNWAGAAGRTWGGTNMGISAGDSKPMIGATTNRNWGGTAGNGGVGNRSWGATGQNRSWGGGDSSNLLGGGVSGAGRNWGANQNRNWGGGLSDSGSFNSGNGAGGGARSYGLKSDRSWDNPYDDEPLGGNSDRWGGGDNLGRSWGNSGSFNRDADDFGAGGANRWNARESRGGYGGGGGDKYDFDGGSNQFGGRGRGMGRGMGPPIGRGGGGMDSPVGRGRGMDQPVGRGGGGWRGRAGGIGNLGGRSQDFDEGFDDGDRFEERRGFGMQPKPSWLQKDFGSEPFDSSQQQQQQDFGGNRRGGFAGRGWGGGQDRRGRGRGGPRGGMSSSFGGTGSSGFGQWQRPKEKPKNVYREYGGGPANIPDVNDETLPKELRQMFQPLFCKLCMLQMSSNIMAKMHYKSKNHEKKIRKFLGDHSLKTGEPLHPRAKVVEKTEKKEDEEEDKDPKHYHCEVCDLPLTGKLHAESHYMGRNHNAVVMGKKQPSGKGHYDENGKWVRDKTEKLVLADGEDTFGMAFRKKEAVDGDASAGDDADGEKKAFKSGDFTCSLCCVTCTCEGQITSHFNGSKHKKKLKQMGISPENFEPPKEGEASDAAGDGDATSTSLADGNDDPSSERNDFSRYKTPSGYFYCEKCNLALNSEVQLKQHLESKNHLKKLIKKVEPVTTTAIIAT